MSLLIAGQPTQTSPVDWESSDVHLLLNPRFTDTSAREQVSLIQKVLADSEQSSSSLLQTLAVSHVFIVSSGTSLTSDTQLKWVALSKQAVLASAKASNQHLESDSSDVWLHTLPNFHVGGLGIWARAHLSGAQVIPLLSWNAPQFVEKAKKCRATLSSMVPAQIYDLVMAGLVCPSSMKAILVGGGGLSDSLYLQARELGWPVLPTYGMTETCSQIATASLNGLSRGDASLQVLPHLYLRSSDEGNLEVSGASLFTAYIGRVESSAGNIEPYVLDPKREGWFLTSDRGTFEEGKLRILGRLSEFIKIGGESVEVARLRGILERLRMKEKITADLALVPVPNERLGHVLHFVCDQEMKQESVDALVAAFNSEVLAFEKIRKQHRIDKIPRSALGKLLVGECLNKIAASS